MPPKRFRTRIVPCRRPARRLTAVLFALLWLDVCAQAVPQEEAAGWLRLKSDQRVYRERAKQATPREGRQLEGREFREGLELRTLQQRQRQELEAEARRERARHTDRRVRTPPMVHQRRESESQRLNRRIQRETLGPVRR